ncbi:MAG: prepilin peptidase [Acidimicrobiales bacterium]
MIPVAKYLFGVIAATLFGLMIGSFLNVVIYRTPRKISLAAPRSFCPACKTPIRALDNIPVLSWCLLRGKCRNCHAPISPRYLLVEALTGIVWGATTAWQLQGVTSPLRKSLYGHMLELAALLIIASVLIAAVGMAFDRIRS